jgi:hypothetical protein
VYFISAGSYVDAGTGSYRVDILVDGDDHGDSISTATPLLLSSSGSGFAGGSIERAGDQDYFQVVATHTGRMEISLNASESQLDTVLAVYNSSGRLIAINDDYGGSFDSRLWMRVRAGQTYYVVASGYGSSTGGYTMSVGSVSRAARRGANAPVAIASVTREERRPLDSGTNTRRDIPRSTSALFDPLRCD